MSLFVLPGFVPGRKQAVGFPPSPPAASLLSSHPVSVMYRLVTAQLGNKQRINGSVFLPLPSLRTIEHSSITHHSLLPLLLKREVGEERGGIGSAANRHIPKPHSSQSFSAICEEPELHRYWGG